MKHASLCRIAARKPRRGTGRTDPSHPLRYRTLAAAVAGALFAGAAAAQEPSNAPDLEEVTVTGTLIRASGMSTPTPVTVMAADELSNIAPGNLIDSLAKLPQFLNSARPDTAASKADAAGASNLNMRSLSSKRTLVLLDGRRIVPSNRLGIVDINLFPEALLQRVETVTGGASAAYGTDAVAGVVNFILDTDYEGVDVELLGGETSLNDNDTYEFSIAGGLGLGERGHLIASFETYESARLDNLAGRDWYKGWGTVTNSDPNGPRLLIRQNVVSTQYTDGGVIDAPGTSIDRLQFNEFGQTTPFVFGEFATVGMGTQNMVGGSGFNPTDFDTSVSTPAFPQGTRSGSFVPDSERQNAFVRLSYEVNDDLNVFGDIVIGNGETDSVGTLPLGHSIWALRVFPENAFLPANIQQAMSDESIGSFAFQRYHTAADIAQDRFIMENETVSTTIGFDYTLTGDGFFGGWVVEGYYQDGTNDNRLDFTGFINREKLPYATDAVLDSATNEVVCNITLFSDEHDDCVPVNLFGRGRASQAAIEYVTDDMFVLADIEQQNAQFGASGEISDGWGAGPVSLALGASWREQSIVHRIGPEPLVNQPGLANDPANGIRGIPLAWQGTDDRLQFVDLDNFEGSFDVKEVYAETLLPLVASRPMVQQLNASVSARLADYSGSGNIEAYKMGIDWTVNDQWRVRTTVSQDVRAASLEERFDRQGQGTSIDDPELDDLTYTTFHIRGGNPEVDPEEADTFTIGAVYQPSWAENLSMSLDWFDIELDGAIDFLGTQEIVDQCSETGAAEFCDRVERDPATNFVTLIHNTFANVDKRNVSGVDLEIALNRPIDMLDGDESLSWRFLLSYLNENSTTEAGAPPRDLVGEVGGAGLPELQFLSNLTYSNGPFSVFLQGRWFDGGVDDIDFVEGVDIEDNTVPSMFYTDLRASFSADGGGSGEWEAFLHVANLFDREPPLIAGWSAFGGTGTATNENLYDVYGRRFIVGFRVRY